MAGTQVTIEGEAVRALTAAARQELTGGAVGQFAQAVAAGGLRLRHGAATAELGTAAAQLRERLEELRTLIGQLADAVDASATTMDTTDSASADHLDQAARA